MGRTKQNHGRPVDEWVNNSYRRRQLKAKFLPKGVVVKCHHCGQDGANQLDHLLPRSKFPELIWDESNIVPAHDDCNNAKSDTVGTVGLGVPTEEW